MSAEIPTIGWSNFALENSRPGTGNSYTTYTNEELIAAIQLSWAYRTPGAGETTLDRKVLVPVPVTINPNIRKHDPPYTVPAFYCPGRMPLQLGMPIESRVTQRQEGEDPYVETYITLANALALGYEETPAKRVNIVCYSAEALEENDGERTTNCEWEIVTILAESELDKPSEPMMPLAMARNFLEKPGGTKGEYSAQEFAEAIYFHSQRGIRVI